MNLSRDPDTIFNGSCIVVKDTVTLPIFLPPIVSFFFFLSLSPFFLRTLSPLTLDTLVCSQVESKDPVLAEMFEFPVSLVFETCTRQWPLITIGGKLTRVSAARYSMENQALMSRQTSARAIQDAGLPAVKSKRSSSSSSSSSSCSYTIYVYTLVTSYQPASGYY